MNISRNKPGAARSSKRVFLSRAALLTSTLLLAILIAGMISTVWAAPLRPTPQRVNAAPTSKANKRTASPLDRLHLGLATWYGKQFHGRHTASGEKFNMFGFTAAHRTLPLGTWLRVTNVTNQKSVLVRINDRGPMSSKYVLDLSYGAAQAIGIAGYANVRIDQLQKDDPEVLLASAPHPVLLPGRLALDPDVEIDGVPVLNTALAAR